VRMSETAAAGYAFGVSIGLSLEIEGSCRDI
jgi:hypothetical protein